MDSSDLLNVTFALLGNDDTFLGYRGWFNKATVTSTGAAANSSSIPVTSFVFYTSGEQVRIMNGNSVVTTATVSQTGSGYSIPVNALSVAAPANAIVQSYLAVSSSVNDKTKYLVKEEETDSIVDNTTIPIVLMYIRPGHAMYANAINYISKLVIDCFAADGNTARMMMAQTKALMQNWNPPGGYVARFAYDTSFKTGITGVKGHRVFYDVSYFIG